MTAKKASQQILAGIDGNPNKPCLFMLVIFKRNGAKDIFQKHGLKYVLGVGVIFQMYHTEPANGIGIPFDGFDRLLFAPHGGSFSYPQRPPRKPFPRPPQAPLRNPQPWPKA